MITTKTRKEVESIYFLWLCNLIERGVTDRRYRDFNYELHQIEFYAITPNDDNRVSDGIELRECFVTETENNSPKISQNIHGNCTMLEMLVALAQRMNYIVATERDGDQTRNFYWMMVENLKLEIFKNNDPDAEQKKHRNALVIDIFLERRYMSNGRGGLFPLKKPHEDQRYVEIWYQMAAYIDEIS